MDYYFSSSWMAIKNVTSVGEEGEKMKPSCAAGGTAK